jgi:hypothetical protein
MLRSPTQTFWIHNGAPGGEREYRPHTRMCYSALSLAGLLLVNCLVRRPNIHDLRKTTDGWSCYQHYDLSSGESPDSQVCSTSNAQLGLVVNEFGRVEGPFPNERGRLLNAVPLDPVATALNCGSGRVLEPHWTPRPALRRMSISWVCPATSERSESFSTIRRSQFPNEEREIRTSLQPRGTGVDDSTWSSLDPCHLQE